MTTATYNEGVKFISTNKKLIEGVKVTKLEKTGFNDMEGSQFNINIKLTTVDGYKNKLFTMLTNGTYMEDFGADYDEMKEKLQDYLNILVMD